jgi:hypothetical protein
MYYISFIFNLKGWNMKKYIVALSADEREALEALVLKGKHKSQATPIMPAMLITNPKKWQLPQA